MFERFKAEAFIDAIKRNICDILSKNLIYLQICVDNSSRHACHACRACHVNSALEATKWRSG